MKGGRKNLKRAVDDEMSTPHQGQSIMQVVDLRALILSRFYCLKVMDSKGDKLLAIFPAKFHKSMWIRRGNFVVIDESGREEAVESGRKVAGMVTHVLYHDQIRLLQKTAAWPDVFKPTAQENEKQQILACTSQQDDNESCSDDDGLPPLEANTNRQNPNLYVEPETDSDTDNDP